MKQQPPMLLRSSPLLSNGCAIREGGHTQWPGKAGSTGVAGVACSAAIRWLSAGWAHGLRALRYGKQSCLSDQTYTP